MSSGCCSTHIQGFNRTTEMCKNLVTSSLQPGPVQHQQYPGAPSSQTGRQITNHHHLSASWFHLKSRSGRNHPQTRSDVTEEQVVVPSPCREQPSLSAPVQVSLLAASRRRVCPALLPACCVSRVSQVQMAVSPRGSPSEGPDSRANIEHGRTGADRKVHTGASKQREVSV